MDSHIELLLSQYLENLPTYKELSRIVLEKLNDFAADFGSKINSVEGRIKALDSLTHKLELKGSKYKSIFDVTDIVGARIVTFYSTDIDKFAAKVEQTFNVDWDNSQDKRKIYSVNQFGYMSVHYICTLPKELHEDEKYPLLNEIKFEIQLRSVLQHAWASIEHDTGYKSDVEIPNEYLRSLNRLASLLELADQSFCDLRDSLEDYRRRIKQVVSNGKFDEIELNGDTFNIYIEKGGFQRLNKKIATINNMEIQEVSLNDFLQVFKTFGFKTLKDLDDFIKEYSNIAYEFCVRQFDGKDIDIISNVTGPLSLCIVYVLSKDMGETIVKRLLDAIYGERKSNINLSKKLTNIGRSMGLTKS